MLGSFLLFGWFSSGWQRHGIAGEKNTDDAIHPIPGIARSGAEGHCIIGFDGRLFSGHLLDGLKRTDRRAGAGCGTSSARPAPSGSVCWPGGWMATLPFSAQRKVVFPMVTWLWWVLLCVFPLLQRWFVLPRVRSEEHTSELQS